MKFLEQCQRLIRRPPFRKPPLTVRIPPMQERAECEIGKCLQQAMVRDGRACEDAIGLLFQRRNRSRNHPCKLSSPCSVQVFSIYSTLCSVIYAPCPVHTLFSIQGFILLHSVLRALNNTYNEQRKLETLSQYTYIHFKPTIINRYAF